MLMPPFSQQHPNAGVPENPEVYAGSLAHILHREGDKIAVVGQAWLAGANKLVTCGHVVEPFLNDSNMLLVKFPASGAEYGIDSMELHPNFARDEQLVKYDVAVLAVRLRGQELASTALPLRFDQDLKNQDTLWTVRYPAHLGALTSAPDPLKQSGRFLGRLGKQDNFHLLHDLALSPGDSGAALFSDQGVVGIHCGDTASLPALNLATTSIRMALWVDALKDLGIASNVMPPPVGQKRSLAYKLCTFFLASGIAVGATLAALAAIYDSELKSADSRTVKPVAIAFERISTAAKDGRIGSLTVTPTAPCHIYVVFKKGPDKTFVLYPSKDSIVKGELVTAETKIPLPEDLRTDWQKGAGSLYMISVTPGERLLDENDMGSTAGKTYPLINNTQEFWNKVKEFQNLARAASQQLTVPSNNAGAASSGAASATTTGGGAATATGAGGGGQATTDGAGGNANAGAGSGAGASTTSSGSAATSGNNEKIDSGSTGSKGSSENTGTAKSP